MHPTCFSVFDNDIFDNIDDNDNHDKENNDNNNNHHNDNNNGKSEKRGQQRDIDLLPALQPGYARSSHENLGIGESTIWSVLICVRVSLG